MNLWSTTDATLWSALLGRYSEVIGAQGVTRLPERDDWYRDQLPAVLATRHPMYATLDDLIQVTEWKMARGVWRQRNLILVRSNAAATVESTSRDAFARMPDPARPIAALSTLSGVGPATASALLSAADPTVYPFFDDLVADQIPDLGKVDYTPRYYARYAEALRERAITLGAPWTPTSGRTRALVERGRKGRNRSELNVRRFPLPLLSLTPDELLSTTRAVRKRLDFTRPVERAVIEECLALAQQAPSGSNSQNWDFVVVTDPAKRAGLAELYKTSWYAYNSARSAPPASSGDKPISAARRRLVSSAMYLADHMHEVPVLVVPCIRGRADGQPIHAQASLWGSILPAAWSFMLAARARGLGTAWTSLHLVYEKEAAAILGIPNDQVMQAALIPLAYTIGTDFQEGPRKSLDSMVHWETW